MMKNRVALFAALVFIFAVIGLQASAKQAEWIVKPLNYDPAHRYTGLCGEGQCFVEDFNNNGENCDKVGECYCINNAEYLADDPEYSGDNYCDNSTWITRTKLVANTLVKFAQDTSSNNFSLYCDSPENALFNGVLPEGFPLQNFNNFCILKYGNNIGIGTSLNGVELSQATLDSMGLGISGYSSTCEAGEWKKCGSVWFNPSINATIWLSSTDSLTTSNTFIQTLFDAIKSFFTGRAIPGRVGADVVADMLDSTSAFDTVYLSKKGTSQIFAYFEQKYVKSEGDLIPRFYSSIAGEYSGINPAFESCASLENYCPEGTCSYLCEPSGATSIFRIYHIGYGQSKMSEVWQDLSSKLRLKSS
jgi:hypothetical protein